MSDPLCMSLDDIIKQKKTKKVLGVRGRGTVARARNGRKVINSPVGRVSRNFKGKLTKSLQNTKTSPKRRGGGQIYFSSPTKNTSPRWQRNQRNIGGNRSSPKRRQQNRGAGRAFAFQPDYQPVFHPRRIRPQRVAVNQRAAALRSFRSTNWQGNLRFARKSVYRARQQLIRTRILQSVGNRGQGLGQYFRTGRIRVGKYGLVTTQRQNINQRQMLMQRKIQRARQIREQGQNVQLDSFVFRAPGRRQQRSIRNQNQNAAESWTNRPASSGRVSRNYTRQRGAGGRGYSDQDDAWNPPLMTVRNSEHDTRVERQPTHVRPAPSGLDPNIQRKIQYIQQQGRRTRNRNIETGYGGPSTSYLPVEEEPTYFQPTIISSRMSLSDRFKRFMN